MDANSPNIIGQQPSPRTRRLRVTGICLLLAGLTFAVFGQTFGHEFVDYDDDLYVYENPIVARGLSGKGIMWAFSQFHAANWHPLTWLSHMADCQLYGLHAGWHHLTNVLIHTAGVIMLFLVLRQMTGALWRSAFVAAVFAIHPLRVESVAWVAERKDVLSGLFFILTIAAYGRYARQPRSWPRYGLVILLFVLGLMSKPMLVTLPVVLLLLDYWPLERVESRRRLLLEKLPLLALSAAGCFVTLLSQQEGIQSTGSFSFPARLANALVTYVIYLGQMVYPVRLAAFYPYSLNGLPGWKVLLAGAFLAGVSGLAVCQRKNQPWILFGWIWYLVMLVPVIGILQVGDQAHADRYTYLPQIGIYVAVTWSIARWAARRNASPAVIGGIVTAMVVALAICAAKQAAYWKNSETLWTHTLACTTRNDVAEFNLGNAFRLEGKMDDAIAHYENALKIRPNYAQAHVNLGHALLDKGQVDDAIAHFESALQTKPRDATAHFNLGNAFREQGKLDDAIAQYQMVLQLKPNFANAHVNLGKILFQRGKVMESIAEYQSALELTPNNAEANFDLGVALLQERRPDEAIPHFQRSLAFRPGSALAHGYLGNAYRQEGRVADAAAQFEEALQIEPANPAIANNLAWLLATDPDASVRNGAKAVELAERANQNSHGGNPFVLCTLAAAYAEAGRFSDAVQAAQHALQLAGAGSNTALASQIESELKLYRAGRPYHLGEAQETAK